MCNIDAWFNIWWRDLVFSFVGVHVIDSGASSALCCEVAHFATVEAWPFVSVQLVCLDCMYLVLRCVFFIILSGIGSWLVQPIVKPIPIIEAVVWESGTSYVHWDWGVIVLPRHIGQVVLRYVVPLLCLVLSSSREEGLTLPLLSKHILKCVGWLYSVVSAYAFNKLFSFCDVDCTLFNVDIVCDERWLHDVF